MVTNTGRGSMLFVRVDHCCADGIALVQVLNRIARRADGRPARARKLRPPRPKQSAGAACCDALAGLGKNLALPVGGYDAQLAISAPADARKAGVAYPPGGRRKIVVVPEHSLNLLKRIKNAASAAEGAAVSINDVVFAAAAGAIRRHTHQTAAEAAVDGARVHALVPVAFRAPPTRRSRTSGPSSRRRCPSGFARPPSGCRRRTPPSRRSKALSTRRWRRCSSRRTRSCRR